MYKTAKYNRTTLIINQSTEGEHIETKIERIVNNKEPITDGAPIIYTERKDGVLPAYDIRTDRFDIAIDAMDIISKSRDAQRAQKNKTSDEDSKVIDINKKEIGGAESAQGTNE